MKQAVYISLLSIFFAINAGALPLTPEEALGRLERVDGRFIKNKKGLPEFRGSLNAKDGIPAIYAYTYSGDEGFLLLSADNAVAPLIGYSESGSFPTECMAENVASWLSLYVDQIQGARGMAPYKLTATRADGKAPIGPLLTTTWNQTSPFNNQCPRIDGARCVTGCVATAMAQVMNYWKYPKQGIGSITYSPTTMDDELTIDFSSTVFDWDNMLDEYGKNYSSQSATAVARLMKACGYSVRMRYSPLSSSAYSGDIANALKTYFGYDKGASQKERSNYSSQEAWIDMIYDNLANVGPVILNGQSSDGGHSFVCDGYDGNGYFHINWGWGGLSDGYFLLNQLTPGEVGTGGGLGYYDGYNMQQDAIIGIMPPVGRLVCMGITVDNAADDSGNVPGKGYVYRILDPSNIMVSVNLRISGGHISSPLYVTAQQVDPETMKNEGIVLETLFRDNINASDGDVTYSSSIRLPYFNPSKFYTLNFAYDLKGKRTTIESVKIGASSGVDEVEADDPGLTIRQTPECIYAEGEGEMWLEVYDTGGRLIVSKHGNRPEISTAVLEKGVYLVRAANSMGGSRQLKLLLK